MPQGLQVWDEGGVEVLNITNRLTRHLGSIQTVANVAGSFTVPDVTSGTIWVLPQASLRLLFDVRRAPPVVTLSGRVISWTAAPQAILIPYGVY